MAFTQHKSESVTLSFELTKKVQNKNLHTLNPIDKK